MESPAPGRQSENAGLTRDGAPRRIHLTDDRSQKRNLPSARPDRFSVVIRGKYWSRFTPSKGAVLQAAPLEPAARPARAQVVAAELFGQLLFAVDDPMAPLDVGLGREPAAAFAHRLEKNGRLSASCWSMIHRLPLRMRNTPRLRPRNRTKGSRVSWALLSEATSWTASHRATGSWCSSSTPPPASSAVCSGRRGWWPPSHLHRLPLWLTGGFRLGRLLRLHLGLLFVLAL